MLDTRNLTDLQNFITCLLYAAGYWRITKVNSTMCDREVNGTEWIHFSCDPECKVDFN